MGRKTLDAGGMKRFFMTLLMLAGPGAGFRAGATEPPVDFVRQIKVILETRCVECHNSETLLGDLNLETRAKAFRKRKAGPVIRPGDPEKSLLYLTLKLPPKDPKAMPATGHRIPPDEVSTVRQWIAEGAQWPEGEEGTLTPRHGKN